jgi:hypothetical protein
MPLSLMPTAAPIPPEYQSMSNIINNKLQLLTQHSPVFLLFFTAFEPYQGQKKKIDEVAKKVEALYQKFREYSVCSRHSACVMCVQLPQSTAESVFYMCQAIQSQDYNQALHFHKTLVASTLSSSFLLSSLSQ